MTIQILPHSESDLTIPRTCDIIARIADLRSDAQRLLDTATARQLDNLTDALLRGMRMTWVLGDLLVSSASTPGAVYTVSCGACDCPARKPCKHLKLAEVLLDMLDTLAGDADMEDEPPIDIPDEPYPPTPGGPEPPEWRARMFGARIVAARQVCWANW